MATENRRLVLASRLKSEFSFYRHALRTRTAGFGVGHIFFLTGRLLRDTFLARLLSAEGYATWAALNILRQYGSYSDLGLLNGLARELPKTQTTNRDRAKLMAGHSIVGSAIGTIVFFCAALILSPPLSRHESSSSLLLVVLILQYVLIEKIYKYLNALMLGTERIREAGLWLAALSLLDLFLAVLGAHLAGLYGLIIGTLAAIAITTAFMFFKRPLHAAFTFSSEITKTLTISSLTLLSFGLLNVALHNLDRTLYVFLEGADSTLGAYHAAALFALSIGVIPYILASVINTKIYSLQTDELRLGTKYLLGPGYVISLFASTGGLVALLSSQFVLDLFFPLQPEAKLIAGPLFVGEIFFAASFVPDAVLLSAGRGHRVAFIKWFILLGSLSAILLFWPLLSHLNQTHKALILGSGIALAQFGCFILSWLYAASLDSTRRLLRKILHVIVTVFLFILAGFVGQKFLSPFHSFLTAIFIGFAMSLILIRKMRGGEMWNVSHNS